MNTHMSALLLDGKSLARQVRDGVATRNASFVARHGRPVGLVAVRVGNDPASEIYVRGKQKAASEAGLLAEQHHLVTAALGGYQSAPATGGPGATQHRPGNGGHEWWLQAGVSGRMRARS